MKKKIKWIMIAIILAGISYLLYSMSKPAQVADPGMESQAITFQVTKETLVHTIRVKGKSLYEQETPVYAPFSSKVTEWKIEDGQQVNKDEVLFRLDQTELKNQITREEAELRKAELETRLQSFVAELDMEAAGGELSDENRKKLLANRESERLTKELEDVRRSIQRQELQQKKLKLQDSEFRAPAAGIFLFDSAEKKPQVLSDNQYIGKIVDLNKLQFTALVGEQDVFRIKPDMNVKVTMSAMKDVPLTGTVKHVSKFAKTGTDQDSLNKAAQFEVTISLEPSEYLIAGLSLTGDIETSRKENVLALPSIAVMRDETSAYVMLDKGSGQYERRDIKTGLETMDKTEVLEGLKEGDTVALQ
ncbi:efflux RND transporter periplasmic adaptor subunit [Paenibacillus woosongensis]|uniref:Efflux RND transporter periplasmic adaptor subunit n=1 Tax=Paenibacillus woosongensis TaxID=307580 RepID=A0AA95L210_9BACL|nr:efflux RND transporter periplasmic adaptor subunit [Paenibacillus woosongensis]WHX49631.1 efflux RND transporter periplasmic adaptor subunit [Paenibacillus woosongensis]